MTDNRFFCADLLRAISAQAVVVSHAVMWFLLWSPTSDYPLLQKYVVWLSSFGHHAVIVFFVLSGFLVGGKTIERISSGKFDFPQYAIDRLFRLWIVAIPAIILGGMLDLLSFQFGDGLFVVKELTPSFFSELWDMGSSISLTTAVCNAAFMQTILCPQIGTNLALWSITNEAVYYTTFPLLMLLFSSRLYGAKRRAAWIVLAVVAVLVVMGKTWSLISGFSIWVAGALTYTLLRQTAPTVSRRLFAAFGAILGAIICSRNGYNVWSDVGASVAGCCLLVACHGFTPSFRLLRQSIESLSAYSYSLYATHLPVMFALLSIAPSAVSADYSPRAVFVTALVVLVTNLVAMAFYWAFERHDQRVRKAVHAAFADLRQIKSAPGN